MLAVGFLWSGSSTAARLAAGMKDYHMQPATLVSTHRQTARKSIWLAG